MWSPGNPGAGQMLAAVLVASGCTSGTSDGAVARMLEAREQWVDAPAAYSAMYVGEPPDGERVQVIITPTVASPCSELFAEPSESDDPRDFWFIKLVLGTRAAGTYDIVNGEDPDPTQAAVTVQHAADDKTAARVAAIGGEVVVDEPVWQSGAQVSLQLSMEFPRAHVTTVECESAESVDGSMAMHSCICDHADGTRSECSGQPTAGSCCEPDPDAGTISLSFNTVAQFCARMCTSVAGLGRLCQR